MKWRAPSDRTQMWLVAPVAVPLAILALPAILFYVAGTWITGKLRPSFEWHPWFAWRPVPLDGWWSHVGRRGSWAWLTTVERRARPYDWPTEYRLPTPTKETPHAGE